MNNKNITAFLAQQGAKFPADALPEIQTRLETMDEARFAEVKKQGYQHPYLVWCASLLGGIIGLDRFLIGQTALGVAKFLTMGGMGFWLVVDWVIIMHATRESNLVKLLRVSEVDY